MPSAFQVRSYITYWLDCVDRHSLHSPFFYDLYTTVVRGKNAFVNTETYATTAETLREKLQANHLTINVTDLGAGSNVLSSNKRKVSDIARTSLSSPKFSQLYSRLVLHYKPRTIIELGTSLGINTLYLANGNGTAVTTFEGSPEIAAIARDTFEFAQAENITLIEGDLAKTLPEYLSRTRNVDFAFIDANHRYEPTMHYLHQILKKIQTTSVVVIDDIHYTAEMERAWNEIKTNPLVYGSADLYRAGILFFDPSLNKQHVVLQF